MRAFGRGLQEMVRGEDTDHAAAAAMGVAEFIERVSQFLRPEK